MDTWTPPTTPAPADGPLVDTFGRVADDLRVSVTDRCNFRCTYRMPAEGLEWLPKHEILTFEEMTRLLGLFVGRLGISSVKVTGGEPTVRADLPELIRMFRDVAPGIDLSMTTNGVLLDRLAQPLADAGLDRVTVSLDSAPSPLRGDDAETRSNGCSRASGPPRRPGSPRSRSTAS